MKLIYSTQRGSFKEGFSYRNPRHFARIEEAESVEVVGDYPEIVKAYENAGIEVVGQSESESTEKLTVPKIKEELTAKGIEFPSSAKRDELLALLEGQ